MPPPYRLLKTAVTNKEAVAGTIVYLLAAYDGGCASDDTRITGIEHTSVTLNADGSPPFFTVPHGDLRHLSN
jgi:hypothetical protein